MKFAYKLRLGKTKDRKALSLFVTAGYPTIESTVPLVVAIANAGADIIELGIPFSDPIADGPTIQASSEIALRNGVTLKKVFEMAKEIRKQTSVPLVLMGYSNPIYAYGIENFFKMCSGIGIDGTIIPDIPLEESEAYRTFAQKNDIATIFLAAPTTSNERLAELDNASTGFLYCVSVTGVTGERQGLAKQSEEFLQRARKVVKKNPLLVGFGISTPDDACNVARLSDGVIIGSALIKLMQNSPQNHLIENVTEFVKSMRKALDT
jgi:tryptophan synthase alpha chain